jgi:hypothetical protein
MEGEVMEWARKAVFDYHEYRASHGNLNFCIDGKGRDWTLRGWIDGKFSVYEHGDSLKALKSLAEEQIK